MGFRNPIHTLTADQITGGNFSAVYNILGRFVVGDPAHAHVVIGSDAGGADGVRIYAADGVTPLIDLNIGGASTVAASTVVGTVAAATNATNATNLAGGGTASGTTTIAGEIVVGNPAAAHVVVGTDANGADGVRLYAGDGVTPLIDLNIAGTPTITGAIVRTAPTGRRVQLDGTTTDSLIFFSGDAAESLPGVAQVGIGMSFSDRFGVLTLEPPNLSNLGAPNIILSGTGTAGGHPSDIQLTANNKRVRWDGTTLTVAGALQILGGTGITVEATIDNAGNITAPSVNAGVTIPSGKALSFVSGAVDIEGVTEVTSGATAGGGAALPATPWGYIKITLDGGIRYIAYYG